jgi:hypothetical protein
MRAKNIQLTNSCYDAMFVYGCGNCFQSGGKLEAKQTPAFHEMMQQHLLFSSQRSSSLEKCK